MILRRYLNTIKDHAKFPALKSRSVKLYVTFKNFCVTFNASTFK